MWCVKNLPIWEHVVRVWGAWVFACASWAMRDSPLAWVFGIAAIVSAGTALVGYCGPRALAGRTNLPSKAEEG
jgi:hypothetical protein